MSRLESHVTTDSKAFGLFFVQNWTTGKRDWLPFKFHRNLGSDIKCWSSRKASSRWKGFERFVGKRQPSDWETEEKRAQLPGGFSQGSPHFPVEPFGWSHFEQLSGWGECRENGRGMFYGVGVRRRCIYVALAGPAARWGLDGPGTLGTFLTNWLDPPSLSISPFPFPSL